MKQKRERLDIIHDILKAIEGQRNIGPTRLLQLSNLSPQMFKEYITELLQRGLIEEKTAKGKKRYALTDKAYIFLERYKVFSDFISQLGL